jgi:hypothetical protein
VLLPLAAVAATAAVAEAIMFAWLCLQILPLAYAFLKRKGPANFKPLRT